MGVRYLWFRIRYELQLRLGWLKYRFPTNPEQKCFVKLAEWQAEAPAFFFNNKNSVQVPKQPDPELRKEFEAFESGQLRFFSSLVFKIGRDYDWITNPINGFRYDNSKHWTEIPDFSAKSGDIKMVWEKSRFSYIYTLIRYDYHFGEDCSKLVFTEIDSWIKANPINLGPNWRCSQEISIRVLNWTYALYYYRNSEELTEARFQSILHVIYWQMKHVAANINFSRIAVRNNHAVTETLMLYLGGRLFPFFPEANDWVGKGRRWFVEEIEYQIYKDGTYLQFSHNYHRVVVQLLSWSLYLSEAWGDHWPDSVYERARRSVIYLHACMAGKNGELPNYGANDGALFFPLAQKDYRDYRPSLNALYYYFNRTDLYPQSNSNEEALWYKGALQSKSVSSIELPNQHLLSFNKGGYYLMREMNTLSFIKCGSYNDRPSHADNLHIDIWWEGENLLRDAGSYMYNTDQSLIRFFKGTKGHNTATLGDHDQMKKGPRFIWTNWSKAEETRLEETEKEFTFYGRIRAFEHIGPNIYHERWVTKRKNSPIWKVSDRIYPTLRLPLRQFWHPNPKFDSIIEFKAVDDRGNKLEAKPQVGYYSGYYAQKTQAPTILFESYTSQINTEIVLK
jgi:hypothetical protein